MKSILWWKLWSNHRHFTFWMWSHNVRSPVFDMASAEDGFKEGAD